MKVSTEVSLYLLSNSLRIYSSIRLLMAFMMTDKKRVVRPVLVLVAVLYYIINSILFLSVNIPVLTLASNLIPLFLISVMIRRKFWVNLLATFFTVLAEVLSEALIMVFVDDSLIASSGLASALLLYMASFFAAYCLSGKKLHRITPVLAFSFLVIPCCCIVFSTMIMRNRGWETTLSAVCMVVVNITVFYIYIQINSSMEQNYRNKMVEQQRRAYKSEMELVKQNTDQIEMFRHDVKNHMSQLRMLLQYQKYDDLERYLLQAENRLQSSEQFVDTGNYIIDNIVNCKLTRAAEMGARIQTDIQMPGENIGIDVFDLNVITGQTDHPFDIILARINRRMEDHNISAAGFTELVVQFVDHDQLTFMEGRLHRNVFDAETADEEVDREIQDHREKDIFDQFTPFALFRFAFRLTNLFRVRFSVLYIILCHNCLYLHIIP